MDTYLASLKEAGKLRRDASVPRLFIATRLRSSPTAPGHPPSPAPRLHPAPRPPRTSRRPDRQARAGGRTARPRPRSAPLPPGCHHPASPGRPHGHPARREGVYQEARWAGLGRWRWGAGRVGRLGPEHRGVEGSGRTAGARGVPGPRSPPAGKKARVRGCVAVPARWGGRAEKPIAGVDG